MDYSPGILGSKIGHPLRFGRVAHRWTQLGPKSWKKPSGGQNSPYGAFNLEKKMPFALAEELREPLATAPHEGALVIPKHLFQS